MELVVTTFFRSEHLFVQLEYIQGLQGKLIDLHQAWVESKIMRLAQELWM